MKKPKLKFSKWYKWTDRKEFPWKKHPGVYMISITHKNLKDTKVNYKDVVYIGMTNSNGGLKSRWNQFDKSIHGKRGHSGGNTIYTDLGHYSKWKKKLYVCGMRVKCDTRKQTRTAKDLIEMGWVAFLEYEALAKFRKLLGKEPLYNKK